MCPKFDHVMHIFCHLRILEYTKFQGSGLDALKSNDGMLILWNLEAIIYLKANFEACRQRLIGISKERQVQTVLVF